MTLSFDEQILEAAKSIAAATAALVKSASAAQRELVSQGKVGNHYLDEFIVFFVWLEFAVQKFGVSSLKYSGMDDC